MHSIGETLDRNRGIGPGFDALRLVLSSLIVCWHSLPICYGLETERAVWTSALGRPFMAILPVFFALSGFLVMGSAMRLAAVTPFLLSRALRIVPALATEITISAIVIGGLLTSLPLTDYYLSPGLRDYFGSLIGRVMFALPGVVFTGNPYAVQINNNLWTIPPELLCYVFMAIVMVAGFYKKTWLMIACAVAVLLLNLGYDLAYGAAALEGRWPARHLVLAFCFGAAAYGLRYRLPYSGRLAAGLFLLGILLLRTPVGIYFGIAALVYVTAIVGATSIALPALLRRGDYSYGVYLYGFPIQQLIAYLIPGSREFYWNILLALPTTLAVAVISWHLVERPALSLRSRIGRSQHARDMRPVAAFFVFLGLVLYAMFLLRFSEIAFLEPTTPRAVLIWIAEGAVAAGALTGLKYLVAGYTNADKVRACP